MAIVRLVKEHGDTLVMVINGSSDVKKAVQALQEGASHSSSNRSQEEFLAICNKSADELRGSDDPERKQLDERGSALKG